MSEEQLKEEVRRRRSRSKNKNNIEFRAEVWSSDFGYEITFENGRPLEIDGNIIGFNTRKEAKYFARLLSKANLKDIDELYLFLITSSLLEYKNGLTELRGCKVIYRIINWSVYVSCIMHLKNWNKMYKKVEE